MSVEQLFTRLREGTKQHRHLRSAKGYVFASVGHAFVSLVELADRHWLFSIVFASLAVMYSSFAYVYYRRLRKASGE